VPDEEGEADYYDLKHCSEQDGGESLVSPGNVVPDEEGEAD
jgi:hypothetical protein